jgi:hypothetical protein
MIFLYRFLHYLIYLNLTNYNYTSFFRQGNDDYKKSLCSKFEQNQSSLKGARDWKT